MKKLTSILSSLSVSLAMACATSQAGRLKSFPSAIQDAAPYQIRLLEASGAAHACPVQSNLALSSRHVATWQVERLQFVGRDWVWEDERGHVGRLEYVNHVGIRDLAVMGTETPFEKVFPLAKNEPAIGEKLYLFEFDFEQDVPPMPNKTLEVTYKGTVGGQVFFKPIPLPGSSGSCILNANAEVVGITSGSLDMIRGWAPAVYGIYGAGLLPDE